MLLIERAVAFLVGTGLVLGVMLSAIQVLVLPRAISDPFGRRIFLTILLLFQVRTKKAKSYDLRDRAMALYAPVALLALQATWLVLAMLGYILLYWAAGIENLYDAFKLSGSSLLTLGFAGVETMPITILSFTEAAIGLVLVALLIGYLPTMYSAFSRREAAVTMLEVRAGSPPSAVEMIQRYHRIGALRSTQELKSVWTAWEAWFADVEETHTSLSALVFFRSPRPERSWVTAAGTIMDAAALVNAAVDVPHDAQADLCIRAGFVALRHIADSFAIPYNAAPKATDPISIAREEFDAAYAQLSAAGVPMKPDRDAAWAAFAGWRVNYDSVLLSLATLVMAPYAPWSSDRSPRLSVRGLLREARR
jgi:hypothetical protein